MQVSIKHISYCLDKANEIADQFTLAHIGADDPERSIDNLKDTCEKYLKVKINISELARDSANSSIWGMFLRYPDHFDIAIARGLNRCWRRFVICKEIFHVVLDDKEFHNMDIQAHIEEVTVAIPDVDSRPGNPVIVEWLAEAAAMEFMFPYIAREHVLAADKGKVDFLGVATKHRVPRVHVEKYLSQPFMDLLFPFSKHKP